MNMTFLLPSLNFSAKVLVSSRVFKFFSFDLSLIARPRAVNSLLSTFHLNDELMYVFLDQADFGKDLANVTWIRLFKLENCSNLTWEPFLALWGLSLVWGVDSWICRQNLLLNFLPQTIHEKGFFLSLAWLVDVWYFRPFSLLNFLSQTAHE